jgi:hypothetical protein
MTPDASAAGNPGTSVNLTANSAMDLAGSLLGLLAIVQPQAAIAVPAIQAGITILNNELIPAIKNMVASGQVTPEQEAVVKAQYEAYRANFDASFDGPEWQIRP